MKSKGPKETAMAGAVKEMGKSVDGMQGHMDGGMCRYPGKFVHRANQPVPQKPRPE